MAVCIQPPVITRLATVPTLAAALGVDASDPILGPLLDRSTDTIQAYAGRVFGLAQWSEMIVLGSSGNILLGQRPLRSIVSIAVRGTVVPMDPTQAAPYDMDQSAGILYPHDARYGWTPFGLCVGSRATILYWSGFVLPEVPPAASENGTVPPPAQVDPNGNPLLRDLPKVLEGACIDMAKAFYFAADRDPTIRSEQEAGIGSTSYLDPQANDGGLPAATAATLRAAGFGPMGIR